MLCSRGPQSVSLSPFMELYWPVHRLCPEAQPLLFQQDLRHMQQLQRSLKIMGKLQHAILEHRNHVPAAFEAIQPLAHQLEKEGECFALTLDTKDFSPDELFVKTVGRKLRVSGKTEKKQEDGKGSYSYRCQEFRQEFDLPEGVDPQTVTCSLAQDGKLHIQAPQTQSAVEAEVVVPINISLEEQEKTQALEKTQAPQNLSSQTDASTDTQQEEH